ncbi:MAG: hypothetical protein R3B72_07360 [Polyangiaceae bacterium]
MVSACSSSTGDQTTSTGGAGGGQANGAGGMGGAGGASGGCEADLESDPDHCGACDRPCAPGQICSGGVCLCDAAVVAPDYETTIGPFFQTSCDGTGCHQGPQAVLGMDLAADPHGAIVDVVSFTCGSKMRMLVEPGHPERSHVMNKLMGTNMCGGQAMPPDDPRPADELRRVSDWICAGAPR